MRDRMRKEIQEITLCNVERIHLQIMVEIFFLVSHKKRKISGSHRPATSLRSLSVLKLYGVTTRGAESHTCHHSALHTPAPSLHTCRLSSAISVSLLQALLYSHSLPEALLQSWCLDAYDSYSCCFLKVYSVSWNDTMNKNRIQNTNCDIFSTKLKGWGFYAHNKHNTQLLAVKFFFKIQCPTTWTTSCISLAT